VEASVDLNIAHFHRLAELPSYAITIEQTWSKLTILISRLRQAIRQRFYPHTTDHKHGFILGSSHPSWDATRHSWRGWRALLLPHIPSRPPPNEHTPQNERYQTGPVIIVTQPLGHRAAVISFGIATMQMYTRVAMSTGQVNAQHGVSADIMRACMREKLALQSRDNSA
jgi:hypothetical protein